MKDHDKLVVQHMLRTSNVILHLKNSRVELQKANSAMPIDIVGGRTNYENQAGINRRILEIQMLEQSMMHRNAKLFKTLSGFDSSIMDPISFISSYDIKQKVVDIVKNTKYVGYLDLNTGKIQVIGEDKPDTQLEQ